MSKKRTIKTINSIVNESINYQKIENKLDFSLLSNGSYFHKENKFFKCAFSILPLSFVAVIIASITTILFDDINKKPKLVPITEETVRMLSTHYGTSIEGCEPSFPPANVSNLYNIFDEWKDNKESKYSPYSNIENFVELNLVGNEYYNCVYMKTSYLEKIKDSMDPRVVENTTLPNDADMLLNLYTFNGLDFDFADYFNRLDKEEIELMETTVGINTQYIDAVIGDYCLIYVFRTYRDLYIDEIEIFDSISYKYDDNNCFLITKERIDKCEYLFIDYRYNIREANNQNVRLKKLEFIDTRSLKIEYKDNIKVIKELIMIDSYEEDGFNIKNYIWYKSELEEYIVYENYFKKIHHYNGVNPVYGYYYEVNYDYSGICHLFGINENRN